jgi:hypothetical protein
MDQAKFACLTVTSKRDGSERNINNRLCPLVTRGG